MDIPESPADEPLDVAELAEVLLRVARRLRSANAAALEGLPVNPHQARALRTIARLEPARPSVVAERLHVAARSATDVVEHLIAGGWVTRSPDPDDRRARLLRLTDAGRALLARVEDARRAAARDVLSALGPDARTAVSDALRPLTTRGGEGSPGLG